MTSRMTAFTAQAVVNAFNAAYPPGSPVALVLDLGKTVETVTAGPAFIAGENLMVSLVEYGQYKLDRVIPLPATEKEFYLPIPCPICERNRLLYLSNEVRCEKCGADTESINLDVHVKPTITPPPPPDEKMCLCEWAGELSAIKTECGHELKMGRGGDASDFSCCPYCSKPPSRFLP